MTKLIFYITIVVTFFSCSEKEIIPLQIGNTWTYSCERIYENGEVELDTAINIVKSKKLVDDEEWFESFEFGYTYYTKNIKGDIWELDTVEDDKDKKPKFEEVMFIKNPIENLGNDYDYYEGLYFEISKRTHLIKTPKGEFECYKYDLYDDYDNELFLTAYLAPGVGVIKYKTFDIDPFNKKNTRTCDEEFLLIDYTLK